MNGNTLRNKTCRLLGLVLVVLGLAISPLAASDTAPPLGFLPLLLEEGVRQKLEVSPEQIEKLRAIQARRQTEILDLAAAWRELSSAEQAAKAAEFRAAVETEVAAVLTPEQRERLGQLQVRRQGMSSLMREQVASQLQLSPQQQAEIEQLIQMREIELQTADSQRQTVIHKTYERKLAGVLTEKQQTAWSALAGAPIEVPENPGATTPAPGDKPATAEVADKADDEKPNADDGARPRDDVKLRFAFRYAPWQDVLDWFADQAGYSLHYETVPEGTFNYTDPRSYTPGEAIDLVNSVLLTKGFALVRHRRMLMLVPADEIPPPPPTPLEKLNEVGDFELATVLFPLERFSATDAEGEIQKLLGPQGRQVGLEKSKAVLVTETGGRLRMIRDLIQRVENPENAAENFRVFTVQNISVDEAMVILRPLLGIPEDLNSRPDGSVRAAMDAVTGKLFISAPSKELASVEQILKEVDKPLPLSVAAGPLETLQLEIYKVNGPDPATVLAVLQSLMTGLPGVRLTLDPATGNIVALARGPEHATIRATIAQMQQQAEKQVKVIQLPALADAALAKTAAERLFNRGEGDEANKNAPSIEADVASGRLLVFGTGPQIAQIESLLQQLNLIADAEGNGPARQQRTMLTLPLSGPQAARAVELIRRYLEDTHTVHVVKPSELMSGLEADSNPRAQPRKSSEPDLRDEDPLDFLKPRPRRRDTTAPDDPGPGDSEPSQKQEKPSEPEPAQPEGGEKPKVQAVQAGPEALQNPIKQPFRTAQFVQAVVEEPGSAQATQQEEPAPPVQDDGSTDPKQRPTVTIAVTPNGLVISSRDPEVLDEIEQLLTLYAQQGFLGQEDFVVRYLLNTKAPVAAATLDKVLGGGTVAAADAVEGAGGENLFGDLASAAFGGLGGSLVSSALGLGGEGSSFTTSGTVRIVPDERLNALFVQGTPQDIQLIDKLLEHIDQEGTPDTDVVNKPRLIPVYNTNATTVAANLKEIYQHRLISGAGSGGGGGRGQPSPEEFIRALRGGRGRSSQQIAEEQEQKMSISVQESSNSLVVYAPQELFEEVERLVAILDRASVDTNPQSTVTIPIQGVSAAVIQQGLKAMLGDQVEVTTSTTTPAPGTPGAPPTAATSGNAPSQESRPSFDPDRARRFMEFIRSRSGDGGGDRGSRGGGDRGGSSRGRGGR